MNKSSMTLESDGEIVETIVQAGEFDSYPFYILEGSTTNANTTNYFGSAGGVMLDKDI